MNQHIHRSDMNLADRRQAIRKAQAAKQLDVALWHLDAILAELPDDPDALMQRCLVLGWLGRKDAQATACDDMTRALRADDTDVIVTLARCALQNKHWVKARDLFLTVFPERVSTPFVRQSLMRTCVELQDLGTIADLTGQGGADPVDLTGYRVIQLGPWLQFVDIAACSNTILRSLLTDDYESDERALVAEVFQPGDCVIDIGCGVGAVTTCIADRVGQANVLAIDANPEVIPLARATTRANGFDVAFRHAVLSPGAEVPADATARFHVSTEFWASSLAGPGQRRDSVDVPVVSLPQLIADHGATALCVDIEGAEAELLGRADLTSIQRIVLELHPHIIGDAACSDLIAHLVSTGFQIDFDHARMDRDVWTLRRP